MNEHIVVDTSKTKEEAIKKAQEKLFKELSVYHDTHTPVLLLVSGGSALTLLDGIEPSVVGPHMTMGVLDERYSNDALVNNFSQLMKTRLYSDAKQAECLFLDTRVQENETQEALRERFEKALKEWKQSHENGKIIITQGIGPDGHTSGVLPFPEDPAGFIDTFTNPRVWVHAYDAGNKNQYPLRVTTTLSFLKLVDTSIVFACGEDKKDALQKIFKSLSEGTDQNVVLAETPARIILDMPQVFVYTDISL